jgi:23S rRNA (cytidine1920-2'-O)/16S rRNA (cytidine1409-2'-O)-methyltransferase
MSTPPPRSRLDIALVRRGLVATRARARDLILRGEVKADGCVALRPAMSVSEATEIELAPGAGDYVSRGYLKLQAALDHFGFDPAGRIALDIGASTGGFTEVLLARGAAKVYAIENGRDQLHPTLRSDPRVISREGFDARTLTRADVPDRITAIVADVSFISLLKVIPPALALAEPGCWLAALIKPQFEADRRSMNRSGIVTDPAVHASVIEAVSRWFGDQQGWRVHGVIPSPLAGGDGNVEFLIGATFHA